MDIAAAVDANVAFESEEDAKQQAPANSGHDHATTEAENKFQQAIGAWRGIDLTNTVRQLDTTASDIVAHQRDSLVQRKDLAQKTKDFRKLDDTGKLSEYKSLLKAYQTFIDLLTNHGKDSSTAFLQLYSSLSEAPDPYPLLEASVESLVISEDTLPKLTSEKEHLQKNVNRLTTQLEETEARLEEERALRKKLESGQETKAKDIEASWNKVVEEKQENWDAARQALEEKVENQDRLLKELKASYEVSQRLDQGGENDGPRGTATAAELEIVSSELERTSGRLADMEARNEQLRTELAQAVSQSQAEKIAIEDDPGYLRLQSENSSLLRKLESSRYEKDTIRGDLDSKLRQAERQKSSTLSENADLKAKLSRCADYDDLRRELDMIKAIEFSTGDDDDTLAIDNDGIVDGFATRGKKDSLEQLLLARNKKLSNEMTVLRVSHQDLQKQLEDLQEEFSKTNAELEKSQNLTHILENDLLRLQRDSAMPSAAMSVAGTYTSRFPGSGRRARASSPTSSIISGFGGPRHTPDSLESLREGEAIGAGSGILPMIQAQRDRFKQKNSQLEEELQKTYSTVTSLRQEIASLQKDNLTLYEKSRYASAYSRGQPAASSSSYTNQGDTSIAMNEMNSGLSKYRSQYEANISPFAAFRGREATRAYKRMSLPERVVFSITRIVLANRTSRNIFAGYCLALHIMIFLMLYWMGSTEVEKHASNLSDVATGAVGLAGGSSLAGSNGKGAGGEWQEETFHGG